MLVQISNKALFSAYLKEQNSRTDITRKTVVLDEAGKLRKITILTYDGVALADCIADFNKKGQLLTKTMYNMYVNASEFRAYCK